MEHSMSVNEETAKQYFMSIDEILLEIAKQRSIDDMQCQIQRNYQEAGNITKDRNNRILEISHMLDELDKITNDEEEEEYENDKGEEEYENDED
uniref:Uncharacterized protein n=1 Tax=Mimivirus LCMiAC02 TaxID=2506609 RepID=A0A4P6VMN9_9VIRU|nr:MAG: hypothetical protein LCMiAC02_05220 [Mimivirus LCMiAC02]